MPNISDIHVDATLTNLSIASKNPMDVFIADKVFPQVSVSKKTDKYFVYDQSYLLRSEAQLRADKTASAIRDHGVTTATYTAEKYSISELVSDDERRNADPAIDPDADATMIVTHDLMLKKEQLFAATALATSVWSNDVAAAATWDNASAAILADIDTAKRTITDATGIPGSMLSVVLPGDSWDAAKRDADILAGFGGGDASKAVATVDHVRAVMGVKNLFIMEAVANSAIEGATASYAAVKTDVALVLYVPDNASLRQASAGYTFSWIDMQIKRWREEKLESDQIEGNMAFDQKVTMAAAGYLITNTRT